VTLLFDELTFNKHKTTAAPALLRRSVHVGHHRHHPGGAVCHRDVRGPGPRVAAGVHPRVRAVLRQVLHHRRDGAGGGRSRGFTAGRHHIPGLLRQGELTMASYTSGSQTGVRLPLGVL